ncbi:hypothetical protein BCR33DRAFT_828214 [Rhizoclosmatium globosum]|uniref:Bulb-type lectin domain-containing protein n=1 Tax=Rhizoclosmatium globosum TaxID=329046 RepID=A0A1Y2C0M3_9FUNG|nr:hypothetical protein BCR33DRAFT_828214 [Rhizoclosmatium globosum]|eukprot:ORY40516.1 hypothetical protein BCR33DRAFT_828214 [Rhizoclosmatium globosum]
MLLIAALLASWVPSALSCDLSTATHKTPDFAIGSIECIKPGTTLTTCQYIGSAKSQAVLIVQEDGNVVAYSAAPTYTWQSRPGSGANELAYRTDGNVVAGLWSSQTWGSNGLLCFDASTGVVSLYNSGLTSLDNKIWESTNDAGKVDRSSSGHYIKGSGYPSSLSAPGSGSVTVDLTACLARASGTDQLKGPGFTSVPETNQLVGFIPVASMSKSQSFYVSCGKVVSPATVDSNGVCNFTLDITGCGPSFFLYNSVGKDSTQTQFTIAIVGDASTNAKIQSVGSIAVNPVTPVNPVIPNTQTIQVTSTLTPNIQVSGTKALHISGTIFILSWMFF